MRTGHYCTSWVPTRVGLLGQHLHLNLCHCSQRCRSQKQPEYEFKKEISISLMVLWSLYCFEGWRLNLPCSAVVQTNYLPKMKTGHWHSSLQHQPHWCHPTQALLHNCRTAEARSLNWHTGHSISESTLPCLESNCFPLGHVWPRSSQGCTHLWVGGHQACCEAWMSSWGGMSVPWHPCILLISASIALPECQQCHGNVHSQCR